MAYQFDSRHYYKRTATKQQKYLQHQGFSAKVVKEGSNYIVYKQRGKYTVNG